MSVVDIERMSTRDQFSDAINQVEKCSAAVYVLAEVMQSSSPEIDEIFGNDGAREAVANNLRILMERQQVELKAVRRAFHNASGEPRREVEDYLP